MQEPFDWLKLQSLDLIQAVLVFNFQPISYAHESHQKALIFEKLPNDIDTGLLGSARLKSHWSKQLLLQNQIEGSYYFDFKEEEKRLALCDLGELKQIADALGLIANFAASSCFIRQADVQRIRQNWGEPVYQLALKYQGRSNTVSQEPRPHTVDELISRVNRDGWSILATWAQAQPPALGRRLMMKLPHGFEYRSSRHLKAQQPLVGDVAMALLPDWLQTPQAHAETETQNRDSPE